MNNTTHLTLGCIRWVAPTVLCIVDLTRCIGFALCFIRRVTPSRMRNVTKLVVLSYQKKPTRLLHSQTMLLVERLERIVNVNLHNSNALTHVCEMPRLSSCLESSCR